MDDESEEISIMVTQEGLFSPWQVLQGMLYATPHFKTTMGIEMLAGLMGFICKVWADDIVIKGCTPRDLQ